MNLDYYEILNVNKNADDKEIRKSYLSKAKQLHPDKNIHNKVLSPSGAEEEFKELQQAYRILSNKGTRLIYDETCRLQDISSSCLHQEQHNVEEERLKWIVYKFMRDFGYSIFEIVIGTSLIGVGITTGVAMMSGTVLSSFSFFLISSSFGPYIVPALCLMIFKLEIDFVWYQVAHYLAEKSIRAGFEITTNGLIGNVKSISHFVRTTFSLLMRNMYDICGVSRSPLKKSKSILIENEEWEMID